jgi:RNA polymerase sigma-70 factor, ECF subfamily
MNEFNTDDREQLNIPSAEVAVEALVNGPLDLERMTDEELLLEYRMTASSAVFETLVKRYERELYNYLRRFLNNQVLAEDAFQATFMQVHLKCHLYDAERKVRPWL